MPKLIYTVDVGDEENGLEYLQRVEKAFTAVTDLQAWGYTQDELVCTSVIDIHDMPVVYDQERTIRDAQT